MLAVGRVGARARTRVRARKCATGTCVGGGTGAREGMGTRTCSVQRGARVGGAERASTATKGASAARIAPPDCQSLCSRVALYSHARKHLLPNEKQGRLELFGDVQYQREPLRP